MTELQRAAPNLVAAGPITHCTNYTRPDHLLHANRNGMHDSMSRVGSDCDNLTHNLGGKTLVVRDRYNALILRAPDIAAQRVAVLPLPLVTDARS